MLDVVLVICSVMRGGGFVLVYNVRELHSGARIALVHLVSAAWPLGMCIGARVQDR